MKLPLMGVLVWSLFSLRAGAQEYPASQFFSGFKSPALALSPNGNRFLALHQHEKTKLVGLIIGHLNTDEVNWAYVDDKNHVTMAAWAKPDRIVFQLRWGLYSVNPNGGKAMVLVKPLTCYNRIVQPPVGDSDEMLIEKCYEKANGGLFHPDVYRINVYTGVGRRIVYNWINAFHWIADTRGVVRIGVAIHNDKYQVWHRLTEDAKWELLGEYGANDDEITPLAFSADPNILFVKTRAGKDTYSVFSYDVKTKSLLTNLFSEPGFDVDDISISKSGEYLGASFEAERPRVRWARSELDKIQSAADKEFPGYVNIGTSSTTNYDKAIVLSYSDRDPGAYYLYSAKNNEFRAIWKNGRHIDPSRMAEMKPIEYAARDGEKIHGYLTLPIGAGAKGLPLIVMPHGGPMARDSWGFDREVQFLANRGYAVLQMNFRGSVGYGRQFLMAGSKQWGRAMQDDITDGVKWAASQGIADSNRVAICGFSYGGYAALVGLQNTPQLYKCGIAIVAPVDLVATFRAFHPPHRYAGAWVTSYLGDPRKDQELLASVSPANHIREFVDPLFLAWGGKDDRIPVKTARQFISSLKQEGKKFESTIYEREGHNGWDDANDVDLHNKIEAFLKKYMPAN